MTTEKNKTTPTSAATSKATSAATSAANDMDSWAMAVSLLTGVRKAKAKAEEERHEAFVATGGNPFGAGVSKARMTRDAMDEAEALLVNSLGQVARANNLPMPKVAT